MNQQMPFDPFKIWKEFYDKSESQWGKVMDDNMQKEDFSQWMGQFLNLYLQYQNMVKQSTEKFMETSNIPSRADISNLASLIVNLESKVDNLEDIFETEVAGKSSKISKDFAQEIDRLKNDLKNFDNKIEQILELVKKQGEQFNLVTNETASTQERKAKK